MKRLLSFELWIADIFNFQLWIYKFINAFNNTIPNANMTAELMPLASNKKVMHMYLFTVNDERMSVLATFSLIAVPLSTYSDFLFDLTFIFQHTTQRTCEWERLLYAHSLDENHLYTQNICTDTHTHTVTYREISIREKKKVSMRAASFYTHTCNWMPTLTITDIIIVWKANQTRLPHCMDAVRVGAK